MRYLLFAGEYYYPSGGAHDLIGVTDSVESAQIVARDITMMKRRGSSWPYQKYDWAHVYDTADRKVVFDAQVDGSPTIASGTLDPFSVEGKTS